MTGNISFLLMVSLIAGLSSLGVNPISANIVPDDSWKDLKAFERSPFYLPPFDATLGPLRQSDLNKFRPFMAKIINFMKNDLDTNLMAQKRQGGFGFGSMFKNIGNAGFLLGLAKEAHNMVIAPEKPFNPKFIENMTKLSKNIDTESDKRVISKSYNKKNVDRAGLVKRAKALLDHLEGIINTSPVGVYLQWNYLSESRNPANPDNPDDLIDLVDETTDVIAQMKAIEYKPDLFDTIYEKMFGSQPGDTGMYQQFIPQQILPNGITVQS